MRYTVLIFLLGMELVLGARQGIRFEEVQSSNELSNKTVTALHQDRQGFLWVGTLNGLNRFDGYSFRAFNINNIEGVSLGTNRIAGIFEDRTGRLWIKAYNNRFVVFNPLTEQFQGIGFNSENQTSIVHFYLAPDGTVCLSTEDSGVILARSASLEEPLSIYHIIHSEGDYRGISGNQVSFVIQDRHKDFWIGTDNGLNRIRSDEIGKDRPLVEQFFTRAEGNQNAGNSFSIAQIHGERIWFSNSAHGLSVYNTDDQKFTHPGHILFKEQNNKMRILSMNSKGSRLWMGTNLGTLIEYNARLGVFSHHTFDDNRSGKAIDEIYCDVFGQLWCLSENYGITRFDPEEDRFHYYKLAPDDSQERIDDERCKLLEDSRNRLWLAGHTIGVQHYLRTEDRFEVYLNNPLDPKSLVSNVVEVMMEDREKNIWVGTQWFGNGLSRLIDPNPAFQFHVPEMSPRSKLENAVRAFYTDKHGATWVGTQSGRIFIYDRNYTLIHEINHHTTPGYSGFNVYSIQEDAEGRVWICTKGAGIFISENPLDFKSYNKLQFRNLRHESANKNSLLSNNIYDCCIDSSGRIWVASFGAGLNLIDQSPDGSLSYRVFNQLNSGLQSNNLRDLFLDENGRLWIATTAGLSYLDTKTERSGELDIVTILPDHEKEGWLKYLDIMMVMKDDSGRIWMATSGGGINQILNPDDDQLIFRHYCQKDGLKDDFVIGLAGDRFGYIWLMTSSCISRFNPLSGNFEHFNRSSGLIESSFSELAISCSGGDRLLIGTSNGFYAINPCLIYSEPESSNLCITDFALNNTRIYPGGKDSPLKQSISYCKKLSLAASQGNFSIGFAQLSYRTPESNYYSYMLEGFDKDWNDIGNKNRAVFTNVPPGDYVFKVKSLDSNQRETGTIASMAIYIQKPVWLSKMAILIYIFVLLVILFVSFRTIARILDLRSRLKAEEMLAESKLRFFTNISHELRTPLTLIVGPLEKLIREKKLDPDSLYQLSLMQRNTGRLLRMVNMILDFRKMQHGKIQLLAQEIHLPTLLQRIYRSFESEARRKNIQFDIIYDQEDGGLIIWGDIQKLDIVFFNLLSNAFKFTPENRSITIILGRTVKPWKGVQVIVRDKGPGISKEKQQQIFKRFFASDVVDNSVSPGTGIGLPLSREYVLMHGGEITIESVVGKGSDFRVVLREGIDHFNKEQLLPAGRPISTGCDDESISLTQLPEDPEPLENQEHRTHVLVVEDDAELAFYLKCILEKHHKVTLAADGIEGWELIQCHQPDLILSDVIMPGRDGLELTRLVKGNFKTSHIPVILLTSKSSIDSQVAGLQTGAIAYLPKPFDDNVLLSHICSVNQQRNLVRQKLQKQSELDADDVDITPKDKEFIDRVMALINQHLSDPDFNVEKLSAMLYISRTLFYRKIKCLTGYQPVELIRIIRLKKAAKYLSTGELTVSEVAYKVGYNDIRYFSISFKKQFGVPPSQYQESSATNIYN